MLYLMLGYPGSGKTTTAKIIHDITGATHLWADKIRNERYPNPTHSHTENLALYNHLNQMTGELLASEESVVFDTAFNFYKDRQALRKIAKDRGHETICIWVQTPLDMAKQRATHDSHATHNTYPYAMSENRFSRISGDFEPPHSNEPYVTVDGTKVTSDYIRDVLKDYI